MFPTSWCAIEWRFTLDTEIPSLRRHLGELLAPLSSPEAPDSVYRTRRLDDGRLLLTLDEHRIGASLETQAIANLLLWSVNQEVAARTSKSVLVHGGAVALDGRAVVLPGASGSGKSTLTVEMLLRGFGYLTDEAVAFSLSDGHISSYHRPICLKKGSWSVLSHLRPAVPHAEPPYTTDVWHIGPESLRRDALVHFARPALLIFPEFDAGASTTLDRLTPGEAAAGLAVHSFNLASVGQRGLDRLGKVAEATPAFRLRHGDATKTVTEISELLARTATS